MVCGRILSTYFSTFLSSCVCLLLVLTVSDARPQQEDEISPDLSLEWQPVTDLWKPKADKDTWRAFEPQKETSQSEWWKEKLDDDLWDPKAHEASASTLENNPPTEPHFTSTSKSVSDREVEKKVTNTTTNSETMTETSPPGMSTDRSLGSDFHQPLFKRGEVNSFVELDPASYYSSSGEYYVRNSWDSSYSKLYQRNQPYVSQESKNPFAAHSVKENKKKSVLEDKNNQYELEQSQKHQVLEDKKTQYELEQSQKHQVLEDKKTQYELEQSQKHQVLEDKKTQYELEQSQKHQVLEDKKTQYELEQSQKHQVLEDKKTQYELEQSQKHQVLEDKKTQYELEQSQKHQVLEDKKTQYELEQSQKHQVLEDKKTQYELEQSQKHQVLEDKKTQYELEQSQKHQILEDKKTQYELERSKKSSNPEKSKSGEGSTVTLKDTTKEVSDPSTPADISQTVNEKRGELVEDAVPYNTESVKAVGPASSHEGSGKSTVVNQDKNMPVSSTHAHASSSEMKEKIVSELKERKINEAVTRGANAVYGKGESLSLLSIDALKANMADKVSVEMTKKPVEVSTKKPNNEFVDWDNWDNSVFDYYEDEENENSNNEKDKKVMKEDKDKKIIKEDKVVSSTKNIKDKIKVEDDSDKSDDDDNYYFPSDDDEYEDEDKAVDKTDHYEVLKDKKGKITMSPVSDKDKDLPNKIPSLLKSAKEFDLDTMDMQADEAASHVDHSHYSKGIIYDSEYPSHMPSIKKDEKKTISLHKEETDSGSSNSQDQSISEKSDLKNTSLKKALSVTHFQPGQLNTESDVSTSPNPPPPGVANNKESAVTMAPSTTPTTNKGQGDFAVESLGSLDKQKTEDNKEFCRVDYECRAGRTCVLGVCKCYTPSMCAGNHKPVCGSDGVQYASHCELHRTACVNRVHIRADRRGRCFQKEIEEHEKSWLMEQERLLQEDKDKQKAKSDQSISIPSEKIVQYSQNVLTETDDANSIHTAVEDKSSMVTDKTTSDTVTKASRECTWKDMSKFKDNLLMFYCQKFVEPNCKEEVKTDREYLSMLMFSYYDKDFDYYLTAAELEDQERDEHFTNNIILNCHLHDFIKFADNLETDSKLTVSEFTSAFEPPIPSIPPHAKVEVISTLASAGNGLELKCGIDAETVVWKRHGAQLSDDKRSHQLMVFDDGALFFSTVGLHHIGNYTCMDVSDESNAQIHRLKVQTLPVVEVTPVTQTHLTGSDIELKCHAEGVPEPVITWKLGGKALQYSSRVIHYYGGGHVVIHNAQFDTDAGTYTCSAHNQAGVTEKSVSVSVLPPPAPSSKESPKEAGTFVAFHSKGISAYDPLSCLLRHQVSGDFGNFKFIPDALDGPLTLCHKGEGCQWGGAVRVGSEFIYVSQPDQSRVVVMNAVDTLNPIQVIDTDKRPGKLWYVKHLDQVWVLCGSQEHKDTNKTIVVIRDASQHIQHRSVHTQPVGNHFDLVQNLFIAPSNDLNHEFGFGYVSHTGQNGLFKINLEDMSYTKAIDLTNYGCVPTNVAFVPIGGHVVIQCVSAADQHTLQLVIDYLTDTVTSATSHSGQPMTSPDSRHLVTVDLFTGKVIVTSVSEEGILETTYEVTVSASISDVAFMTAMSHQGYDLVLTSTDDNDVIIMNLVTGKVEKLKGSKYTEFSTSWDTASKSRKIVTGNSMSNYLMTPSKSSLAILDVKFKQMECEFLESMDSEVMVYIPSTYTS